MSHIMSHMRLAVLLCGLMAGPALAQHKHGSQHTPYAGLQHRAVKALSDEQVAELRAGRGMGLALAAELNGYPGPIHVLEHAKSLGLSAEQHARVNALYEARRGKAVSLGERLIEQETELDRQFAHRRVTPASLDQTTAVDRADAGRVAGGASKISSLHD